MAAVHVIEDIPLLHIQSEKLLSELLDDYKNQQELVLTQVISDCQGKRTNSLILFFFTVSLVL